MPKCVASNRLSSLSPAIACPFEYPLGLALASKGNRPQAVCPARIEHQEKIAPLSDNRRPDTNGR